MMIFTIKLMGTKTNTEKRLKKFTVHSSYFGQFWCSNDWIVSSENPPAILLVVKGARVSLCIAMSSTVHSTTSGGGYYYNY